MDIYVYQGFEIDSQYAIPKFSLSGVSPWVWALY